MSMDTSIEPPIRGQAIVNEHTCTLAKDAMRLDGAQAPFLMHAIPRVERIGDDVQPMQFALYAQSRFVGVGERCRTQLRGDQVGSSL